jgi:hypothetical protein
VRVARIEERQRTAVAGLADGGLDRARVRREGSIAGVDALRLVLRDQRVARASGEEQYNGPEQQLAHA